jgi:hypothetical protein
MKKAKKINPLSLATFQAFIFALIGLVAGILYSFGGLIIDTLVSLELIYIMETPGLSYGTVLAFGALIGMPLLAAIVGLVIGFIGALFYNFFSKWLSRVEFDFWQK